MMSLPGSEGGLGDTISSSVGIARFEFLLILLTAAGVLGSGAAVLVSAGSAWAVSARAGKAGHSDPLVRTLGEKDGVSG